MCEIINWLNINTGFVSLIVTGIATIVIPLIVKCQNQKNHIEIINLQKQIESERNSTQAKKDEDRKIEDLSAVLIYTDYIIRYSVSLYYLVNKKRNDFNVYKENANRLSLLHALAQISPPFPPQLISPYDYYFTTRDDPQIIHKLYNLNMQITLCATRIHDLNVIFEDYRKNINALNGLNFNIIEITLNNFYDIILMTCAREDVW
jgi:hypothetical protein